MHTHSHSQKEYLNFITNVNNCFKVCSPFRPYIVQIGSEELKQFSEQPHSLKHFYLLSPVERRRKKWGGNVILLLPLLGIFFSPEICMTCFLISFKSFLRCHLPSEAFPRWGKLVTLPLPPVLSVFHDLFFSIAKHLLINYVMYLTILSCLFPSNST